jgi:hypothetical protein
MCVVLCVFGRFFFGVKTMLFNSSLIFRQHLIAVRWRASADGEADIELLPRDWVNTA